MHTPREGSQAADECTEFSPRLLIGAVSRNLRLVSQSTLRLRVGVASPGRHRFTFDEAPRIPFHYRDYDSLPDFRVALELVSKVRSRGCCI